MSAYYNENDSFAAAWLRNLIERNLIAPGDVDERSIIEVQPDDLRGYDQCHFFAGIGGWSYALRLAGWPDDRSVWTGSCPCQPFSSAARGRVRRKNDTRHLWPIWHELIAKRTPRVVFGEQVAGASDWVDQTCADMESLGYSVGAAILPACPFGFDHARYRFYYVCDANSESKSGRPIYGEMGRVSRAESFSFPLEAEDGIPSRMATMRAYGNAIVPQVAAEVIKAYLDCRP